MPSPVVWYGLSPCCTRLRCIRSFGDLLPSDQDVLVTDDYLFAVCCYMRNQKENNSEAQEPRKPMRASQAELNRKTPSFNPGRLPQVPATHICVTKRRIGLTSKLQSVAVRSLHSDTAGHIVLYA